MLRRFAPWGPLAIALISITKRHITKLGGLSALQAAILTFGSATAVFVALYLTLWGFSTPAVLPRFWVPVFVGLGANALIQWFNFKAASLDKGEVSLTAPLQAMTPGLITLLALTLGEFPGKLGWAGVCFMIVGSYILTWDKAPEHWFDYLGPLRRLRQLMRWRNVSEQEKNKTVVVLLALGSAVLGTIGLLCDGLYTRRAVSFQGLLLASMAITCGLALIYSCWYIISPDNAKPAGQLMKSIPLWPKKNTFFVPLWIVLIFFGIAWVVHVSFVHTQFNHSYVAYVGTLKRFSILLTVPLSYMIFGEGEFKKRMWAAAFIVVGAGLISLDGLPARLTDKVALIGL